jgi:hypothetical protein
MALVAAEVKRALGCPDPLSLNDANVKCEPWRDCHKASLRPIFRFATLRQTPLNITYLRGKIFLTFNISGYSTKKLLSAGKFPAYNRFVKDQFSHPYP